MVALAVHLLVYGCWPAQALNTVYKEAAASHRSTDVSNTTGACIATTATWFYCTSTSLYRYSFCQSYLTAMVTKNTMET